MDRYSWFRHSVGVRFVLEDEEHENSVGQSSHSRIKDSERGDFHKSQLHLAESMRLQNEIKLLREQLKSEHKLSARLEMKRRIRTTKMNLTRERIFKRLHGEGKRSVSSKVRSRINTWVAHAQRGSVKLRKLDERTDRKLRFFLHMKLPPSILSLGSLDVSEKGMDTKEWIRNLRPRRRNAVGKDTR